MSPTRSPVQLLFRKLPQPSETATARSLDRHWLRSQSSLSQHGPALAPLAEFAQPVAPPT
jgi:hypothetical protein